MRQAKKDLQPGKTVTSKKKTTATAAPKKTAPKKTAPKKTAPKKTAPKKTAPKKTTPSKKASPSASSSMIDLVVGLVRKSRNGIAIEQIRQKTGYGAKQVWNLVYKAKKQGRITSSKKGVYTSPDVS